MFERIAKDHEAEAAIIGRILCAYTELEFGLLVCVGLVTNDFNGAIKALYRSRGETQRVEIADGIGRIHFQNNGIGTEFESAIGALHYCRKIRNLYSHCHWHSKDKTLYVLDLEELAKLHAKVHADSDIKSYKLTLELLHQQEAYFNNTQDWLFWIEDQLMIKLKHEMPLAPINFEKPKQLERPPRYIAQE